jgi:hypothetical protein
MKSHSTLKNNSPIMYPMMLLLLTSLSKILSTWQVQIHLSRTEGHPAEAGRKEGVH